MSKAKQNTFLTGYFAILAAGAAGLGYLAWSSSSATTEAEEKYTTTKAKLLALQKAPIFPKQENVDAKKVQVDAYAAKVGGLNNKLHAVQTPLADAMTSAEFQAKLQKTRDAIAVDAKNAGVKLPEKFDLGFGTYLSTFPETQAVPQLNAWMEGLQHFFALVVASGVKEINAIDRLELNFEKKGDTPPAGEKAKPAPKPATTAAKGKKPVEAAPVAVIDEKLVLERYPFNITFTTSNRSLNDLLTALASSGTSSNSPYFYNIRVLRIENEQKTGAETSAPVTIQEMTDPDTQKPFKRDSVYIFGVEKIQVHLGLELIRFAGSPEVAEAKK
jgi:hypothetical protein